jgi:small subunit ribosomal protein S16
MSVKIRLTRHGAKKKPFYRVVASDTRSPRDGKFIELLGTYNPKATTGGAKIDVEKIEKWVSRGAQMSESVSKLVKKARAGRSQGGASS